MSRSSRASIRVLHLRRPLGMLIEHSRRDVAGDDSCTKPGKLEREPPRTRTRVEHPVSRPDVLAEQAQMDLEVDAVHRRRVEALPLALAVVVEESCDVVRVVRDAHDDLERRTVNPGLITGACRCNTVRR